MFTHRRPTPAARRPRGPGIAETLFNNHEPSAVPTATAERRKQNRLPELRRDAQPPEPMQRSEPGEHLPMTSSQQQASARGPSAGKPGERKVSLSSLGDRAAWDDNREKDMEIISSITNKKHDEFFAQAIKEIQAIAANSSFSMIGDSVAVNRQLAEYLTASRKLVEDEALLVIEAMTLAFDGKSEKLKNLKSATEMVSAESAFMKGALNTIDTKTAEIERLTSAIDALSQSMQAFKSLVDDGTLDRAARAAQAISN